MALPLQQRVSGLHSLRSCADQPLPPFRGYGSRDLFDAACRGASIRTDIFHILLAAENTVADPQQRIQSSAVNGFTCRKRDASLHNRRRKTMIEFATKDIRAVPHSLKVAAAFIALGFAAPVVSGCASPYAAPPPAEPIAITPQTDAALSTYLRTVKVTRPGAFAVSPDGRNSFYTYCDNITCAVTNYSFLALRGCHGLSGTPCVILYVRNDPRVAFTRGENIAAGGRHGSERQREIDIDVNKGR